MKRKQSVRVMMSTFNGAVYLKEQIDSILNQQDVEVFLTVRDDGSSDNTLTVLSTYGNRIRVVQGNNIGVGNSFMEMVYETEPEAEYFAFADQDDVWKKEKLSEAVLKLEKISGPALYCSNQMLTDKNGKEQGLRYHGMMDTSYMQIICENRFSGCTMVWNRELQQLLQSEKRRPSAELLRKRIHDVWVGAAAAVTGTVIYDPEAYILYRQHENNVVGAKKENKIKLLKKKLMDPTLRNGRSDLCRELLNAFDDTIIDEQMKDALKMIATYKEDPSSRRRMRKMHQIASMSGESVAAFRLKMFFKLV